MKRRMRINISQKKKYSFNNNIIIITFPFYFIVFRQYTKENNNIWNFYLIYTLNLVLNVY